MKFNFDEPVNRRGTQCVKWDLDKEGTIPMWVADMDFKTAPAIVNALLKRAQHGVFGYTHPQSEYYTALINWFKRRHNWNILPGWVIYTIGVVPAISAIIKAVCKPGDKVLVQTPVYNCFFSSIRNNGCEMVSAPLVYQKDGSYTIDFDAFEKAAADPQVKLFLLCNPHNPAGRVWGKEELTKLGEICLRHQVLVASDEIHCEIISPHFTYTPFGTLAPELVKNSVTCVSASKAFNLAGLQTANIVVQDPALRAKIDKAININEVCDIGPFGVTGTMAAYNEGEEWLDELNAYIYQNYEHLCSWFNTHFPSLIVTPLQGTYLAWVNIKSLGLPSEELAQQILQKGRVRITAGTVYGAEGEGFIRINLACPRVQLDTALTRLGEVLKSL